MDSYCTPLHQQQQQQQCRRRRHHWARLQSARRLLCEVMQLFCLTEPDAAADVEAEAMRHWLTGLLDDQQDAAAAGSEGLLRFHSRPDRCHGVSTVQEVELFDVPVVAADGTYDDGDDDDDDYDDACSRCLDSADDDLEKPERQPLDTRCFLWFVYQRPQVSYKVGLLYCTDTGSWVQFATHRFTDQLISASSGLFDRYCPQLPARLHRILVDLKYSLVPSVDCD